MTQLEQGQCHGACFLRFLDRFLPPIETSGSYYNLTHLRDRGIKLAIVQSDVLQYVLGRPDNSEWAKWAAFYKYILPLYPEDVHLVARKSSNFKSLSDLAGKNVAIGDKDSGIFVTSTLILKESQVQAGKVLFLNPKDALKSLLSDNLSDDDPAVKIIFGLRDVAFTASR
jgi:uncharacterized protein